MKSVTKVDADDFLVILQFLKPNLIDEIDVLYDSETMRKFKNIFRMSNQK